MVPAALARPGEQPGSGDLATMKRLIRCVACRATPSRLSRKCVQPGHGRSRSGPYMKLYSARLSLPGRTAPRASSARAAVGDSSLRRRSPAPRARPVAGHGAGRRRARPASAAPSPRRAARCAPSDRRRFRRGSAGARSCRSCSLSARSSQPAVAGWRRRWPGQLSLAIANSLMIRKVSLRPCRRPRCRTVPLAALSPTDTDFGLFAARTASSVSMVPAAVRPSSAFAFAIRNQEC